MLAQELLTMCSVPKSFGSSRARRGKGAGTISAREALRQIRAAHVLMQEACIKTIPGSDCIYWNNLLRYRGETIRALLRERSFAAEFHDQERN